VAGHATLGDQGAEGLDVGLLVLAFVIFGVGLAGELSWGLGEGVPASNVGGDTKDLLGGSSGLPDGADSVGSWL